MNLSKARFSEQHNVHVTTLNAGVIQVSRYTYETTQPNELHDVYVMPDGQFKFGVNGVTGNYMGQFEPSKIHRAIAKHFGLVLP